MQHRTVSQAVPVSGIRLNDTFKSCQWKLTAAMVRSSDLACAGTQSLFRIRLECSIQVPSFRGYKTCVLQNILFDNDRKLFDNDRKLPLLM